MLNLKKLLACNIYKYRLYGFINLIVFLLFFAGGISIMFLGVFSIIPRYLISFGLIISIFCFFFLYWSILSFIKYGQIKGNIETTEKWRKRAATKTID